MGLLLVQKGVGWDCREVYYVGKQRRRRHLGHIGRQKWEEMQQQFGGTALEAVLREWIEGRPMQVAQPRNVDYYRAARRLVSALHRRGVAHNDLANRVAPARRIGLPQILQIVTGRLSFVGPTPIAAQEQARRQSFRDCGMRPGVVGLQSLDEGLGGGASSPSCGATSRSSAGRCCGSRAVPPRSCEAGLVAHEGLAPDETWPT